MVEMKKEKNEYGDVILIVKNPKKTGQEIQSHVQKRFFGRLQSLFEAEVKSQ